MKNAIRKVEIIHLYIIKYYLEVGIMSLEINNSRNVTFNKENEIEKLVETSVKNQQKTTKTTNSTAQTETYRSTKEYSEYLSGKYSCLKPANGSSVVINPNLLAQAASDEKTAEWLEYNLGLMPDVMDKIYESAAQSGSRVISCEVSFDGYDSMTTHICGVFEADPGTDEAKKLLEEAREKNKERREKQEKMLEENKERKQAEKVRTENLQEKKIVSSDANSLLNMIAYKGVIIGNSTNITSIDVKA